MPAGLRIPARVRHRLLAEARASAPREACGALLGTSGTDSLPDRVRAIAPLANVAEDPVRGFAVDPCDLAPLLRTGAVLGIYHSHPRGGTRPSEHDVRYAWKGWWSVIVSPCGAVGAWRGDTVHA